MAAGVMTVTVDEIITEISKLPEDEKFTIYKILVRDLNVPSAFDFWDNEEDSVYDDL